IAAAINAVVASVAFAVGQKSENGDSHHFQLVVHDRTSSVYLTIALSGLCAMSAEVLWTRTLGLLFGSSVYTLSLILAVFLTGLGIGSCIGSWISRSLSNPIIGLGWCQLLAGAGIAWTAWNLAASLPYWPVNPSLASNIWFNFQLDLVRAFWAV